MESADRGRQTAGGRHPRRIGFPACQKAASERGARKNFVTLRLGGLFFSHHEGTKTQRLRKTVNEWGTADGRPRDGRRTGDDGGTANSKRQDGRGTVDGRWAAGWETARWTVGGFGMVGNTGQGAGSSGGRGSNASGAAGGAGSEGKAHPKTGLNGVRASQAKGDGLEDRP
jgi:hypothetical protein